MKPDPFPREKCHRDLCPITRGDKGCRDTCFQGNVNYTIECARCQNQYEEDESGLNKRYVYFGETSRGGFVRFPQHISNYLAHKNFMWEHVNAVHNGVISADPYADFFMVRHALDGDPTRRVLRESVRISCLRSQNSDIVSMNGKHEWFGVRIVQPSFTQE